MPDKRLGYWISRDDGKIDLGVQPVALTDEAWAEFENVISVTTELRPFVVDFLSLEDDFKRLERVEDEIASQTVAGYPLKNLGLKHLQSLAAAQGAVSNFLSSAGSFRERAKTRLRIRYGDDSEQLKWIEDHEVHAYDNWFAYRLLYNMRNYGQHFEMPISLVPLSAKRETSGQFQAVATILVSPKELLESPLIQKSFREKELVGRTEDITLLPLAKTFMRIHGMVLNAIVQIHLPKIIEFQNYVRLLLQKMNLPPGAVPMIFEVDGEKDRRFYHFSFDEIAFLRDLTGRLERPEPDLAAT